MKKWFAVVIVLILAIAGILFVQKNHSNQTSQKEKIVPAKYSVLDDSIQMNQDVDKWVKDHVKKQGFYTKKTNKETFVLMSGGIEKTTGYGIGLDRAKQEGNNFNVEYEVVAPPKSEKVQEKETNPHMLLRIDTNKLNVEGNVTKSK